MDWTHNAPIMEGLYLLSIRKGFPRVVNVYSYCDDLCFNLTDSEGTSRYNVNFVRFFEPLWYGPISNPINVRDSHEQSQD